MRISPSSAVPRTATRSRIRMGTPKSERTRMLTWSPTRSAFLELKDERDLIREGYEFLDEKRMIVAQEMLIQLAAYRETLAAYTTAHEEAVAALEVLQAGQAAQLQAGEHHGHRAAGRER